MNYAPGKTLRQIPWQGRAGIFLIIVFWPLNWMLPGLRTHILFFPLWLGYILTVDGLVFIRKGTSLLTRSLKRFIGLFFASAPAWWLFELINSRVQNWRYLGEERFSDLQFFILSTVSFSTVIPAVFGTAELWSTFIKKVRGPVIRPTTRFLTALFATGILMLTLLLIWPLYFFPFLWLSLFFILEPINAVMGFSTLIHYAQKGDWTPVVTLALGALTCGFFWEMWNYFSFPKWIYSIPYVGFVHIFEMPILGYAGYLPFALEIYALYSFLAGILGIRSDDFLSFSPTGEKH